MKVKTILRINIALLLISGFLFILLLPKQTFAAGCAEQCTIGSAIDSECYNKCTHSQVCTPESYKKNPTGRCGGCTADMGEAEVSQCNADGSGYGNSWGECSTAYAGPCKVSPIIPPNQVLPNQQVCLPDSWDRHCTKKCNVCSNGIGEGEQEVRQCRADGSGYKSSTGECSINCDGYCGVFPPVPFAPPAGAPAGFNCSVCPVTPDSSDYQNCTTKCGKPAPAADCSSACSSITDDFERQNCITAKCGKPAPAADCSSVCSSLLFGSSDYQQCVNNACSKAPAPAAGATCLYDTWCDGTTFVTQNTDCSKSKVENSDSCKPAPPPAGAPPAAGAAPATTCDDQHYWNGLQCATKVGSAAPPAANPPSVKSDWYCPYSNRTFTTTQSDCEERCNGMKCTQPVAQAAVIVPISSTPTGTITGPNSGTIGQPLTFSATVRSGSGNLTESNIYLTMADGKTLPVDCPKEKVANTIWCNISKIPFSGNVTSNTYTASWTPTRDGSYTVIVNATNSNGQHCTGNTYNATGGWPNCGKGSAVSVTINSTVVASPVCKGDFNNDGKLDNSDLEFWYASMTKGSSTAHCSSNGGDKTDLSDFYNWWSNKQ